MTALRQVRLLLALRWRMLRTKRARIAAFSGAVAAGSALVGGLLLGIRFPGDGQVIAETLMPGLLLAFVALAVLGGLASGGGTEIVPASQLVAYPVSPTAVFLGSVVLSPLNFTWTVQVIILVTLTGAVAPDPGSLAVGLVLVLAFCWATTVLGLAASWSIVGVRQGRIGRLATNTAGMAVAVELVVLAATYGLGTLSAEAPTRWLVAQVAEPGATAVGWLLGLATIGVVAGWGGSHATAWTLRRRDESNVRREGRPVARRRARSSSFAETLAVDRASVWRSSPIRRGMLLMGIAPGVAGAVGATEWFDIVILPALIAAGAALLFGINAFSLDGPGALWLESTPRNPQQAFLSKAWVTAEVCLAAIAVAGFIVAVRFGPLPSLRLGLTLVLTVTVGMAWAVALAMRRSVTAPHRADLRTARDTPAPPAAMLGNAVRLGAMATVPGVTFVVVNQFRSLIPALILTSVLLGAASLHLWRSTRLWASFAYRSGVATTVTLG